MSTRLLVLSSDPMVVTRLRALAGSVVTILNALPDACERAARAAQPHAIVLDLRHVASAAGAMAAITSARRTGIAVFAIADTSDVDLVLACFRGGAQDVLEQGAEPDWIKRLLAFRSGAEVTRVARLHTVFSPAGGPEDQDFAANLALGIALSKGAPSTLLIDCGLPVRNAAIGLNVSAQFGVQEAISENARLDKAFLDATLARCPRSGLYVLPIMRPNDRAQLLPDGFLTLLETLRLIFDQIVIFAGDYFSIEDLPLREGDSVHVCANQRLSSVKAASESLIQLRSAVAAFSIMPVFVLAVLSGDIAPSPEAVRKAIGGGPFTSLEVEWRVLVSALNQGVPLMLNGRTETEKYRRGIDECLRLAGIVPRAISKRAFWFRSSSLGNGLWART